MNRKTLRTLMFARSDYAPSGSDVEVERANSFINMALQSLVSEAPFLFHKFFWLRPLASIESDKGNENDLLEVDYHTTIPATYEGYLLKPVDPTVAVDWPTDKTWDWQMYVYGELSNGEPCTRRVRTTDFDLGTSQFRIVLEQPWPELLDSTGNPPRFRYTISQPFLWLPSDVVQVLEVSTWPSGVLSATAAYGPFEYLHGLMVPDSVAKRYRGAGVSFLEGPEFSPPTPQQPPQVELDTEQNLWVGPEPPGKFQYRITLCFGRIGRLNDTTRGFQQPLFESDPSEPSDEIETSVGGPRINVKMPDIDWMLNFHPALPDPTTTYYRDKLSGVYWRIYRRRLTADSTGAPATIVDDWRVWSADSWELIAETEGAVGIWSDDGSDIPDKWARVKESQHYRSIQIDQDYDPTTPLLVKAVVRPRDLQDDADSPEIPAEANEILLARALSYWYEHLDDDRKAGRAETVAQKGLDRLRGSAGEFVNQRHRRTNPRLRMPRRS